MRRARAKFWYGVAVLTVVAFLVVGFVSWFAHEIHVEDVRERTLRDER